MITPALHEELLALVNQRRRQLHIHSILYYYLDEVLIPDHIFDQLSEELVDLQKRHPEILGVGYRPDLFFNWTGDTGMHLPANVEALNIAHHLIRTARRKELT